MTAIADYLLEHVKQYAQSLKKQLDLPTSNAQELAAKLHNFASWHELRAVARRDPFDERLRGAALCHRSSPAEKTIRSVEVATHAEQRMAMLIERSETNCIETNRKARGLSVGDLIAPDFHMDYRAACFAGAPGPVGNMDDKFRINLFDPAPRFVAVWGATGWGKSALGTSIAMAHASKGGNVCYLDPFIGESHNARDWPGGMRNAMLNSDGGSQQTVSENGSILPFTRITGIGCAPYGSPKPSLDVLLRNIGDNLLPLSVLIIDEPALFPASGREKLVAHEIDKIIASGSAVVWLSQDMPTSDSLPLNKETLANTVLLLGRTYAWTQLPEAQAGLVEIARQLPMERGKSNCWIAAVSSARNELEAYILEVGYNEIERQSANFTARPV